MDKMSISSLRRACRVLSRITKSERATLYRPFWGYDTLRHAYLYACQIGLVKFDWGVTRTDIGEYLSSGRHGTGKPQTMVEEGHLGGYIYEGALGTHNPILWTCMIDVLSTKAILDIGCGRGHAVSFFSGKVPVVVGIEGSIEAVNTSVIPDRIIHHDYTAGLSPIAGKFDLGWCSEVVEHIEEGQLSNLISDFQKCRFLAMTYAIPGQGGYHHVNEQFGIYWIVLLAKYGFAFCRRETELFRQVALLDEVKNGHLNHFARKGLFFVNRSQ